MFQHLFCLNARMILGFAFVQDKQSRLVGSKSVSGFLLFSVMVEELSFLDKDDNGLLCLKVLLFDLPFGLNLCGKDFFIIVID
jgi:hypothetical protein